MARLTYTPEMGQTKPDTDFFADLGYYGKHYYVYAKVPVGTGRGIKDLDNGGDGRDHPHSYRMTTKAFEKFCQDHDVAYCLPFD